MQMKDTSIVTNVTLVCAASRTLLTRKEEAKKNLMVLVSGLKRKM